MSSPPLPGEDALIAALASVLPAPGHTRLAIGDDAAAIPMAGGDLLLVTTDLLMEDVHFRLAWDNLPALGWKALAQNLSDIAAMGGLPTHAVIGLAIPPQWPAENAVEVYRGMSALAAREQVDIVGGDTIRSSGPLTLSLTVLGRVREDQLLTRAGAQAGDALFVTGTLGRAAAGLRVLDAGAPTPPSLISAVEAQLRPTPRLAAGRALATSGLVSAMMDLSDGAATDLHRLCLSSRVGADIIREAVPIDPVVAAACQWLAQLGAPADPLQLALAGGEDFELLFTAPAAAETELSRQLAPLPITRIGAITAAPEVLLTTNGVSSELAWGFTHF